MATPTSRSPSSRPTEREPTSTPWGQYLLLYAVFFLMGAEMYLVSPLLPTISRDLRAAIGTAAMLVTSYVLAYAIAGPLLGIFADKTERRVFITGGVVVFLIGNVLCALAPTIGLLIAARAITGLGGAIAAPAMWAYLAERSADHQRGKAISWGASLYSLGQVLGVPLGAAVAVATSWRWVFVGIGLLLACTVPILALRLRGPRPTGHATLADLVRPWRIPKISLGLVATILLQAGRLGTYTFVGVLFAQRFGLSLGELGLVGLLVGLGSFFGSLITGPLLDRARAAGRNEMWLAVGWACLFTPAVVVAVITTHLVVALAALFVWFVAGGAFYSTQQAYFSSVDPAQRASLVSWNNSMMNAGIAIGTSALGLLTIGSTGFAALAGLFGLTAAACALLTVSASRHHARAATS
jgi:predicted MFS family arabinose efflux permease